MKTTATPARVSTVEFVSLKDPHMSVTALYTGLELTVKVSFLIRTTFCQIQETILPLTSLTSLNRSKHVSLRNLMKWFTSMEKCPYVKLDKTKSFLIVCLRYQLCRICRM